MKKDRRLYATLALDFDEHEKIAVLSDAAFRALIEMMLWCRRRSTDGRIARAYAEKRWSQAVLDELAMNHPDRPSLVRVGGGDYQIHDYAEHQVTSKQISADRKQEISEKRAAAGRASGRARRNKIEQTLNKPSTNANKRPEQNANKNPVSPPVMGEQTNKPEHRVRVRDREIDTGYLERASYVSDGEAAAHARASELAMSERTSLSAPVSVGASRLVAALVSDKVSHADRTVLRIKASEAIHQGRSDDDVAECIRIWLTKPELGPNALLCCLSEVDKRKLTGAGAKLAPADQKGLKWLALGRQRPNGAVE